MQTSTEYRENIKTLMTKVADLDAKCVAEGRDPDETEVELKTRMLDKVEDIRNIVTSLERAQRIKDELGKPVSEPISKPNPAIDTMTQKRQEERDKFGSFGEQMAAIMRAGMPGGRPDPRLFNTRATGLGESIPSDGGFLVQQDFSSELLKQVWETGKLASLCRRITVSGNANSIKINGFDETSRANGSRQGGVRGYWLDEAGLKTASKPTFRKIELNLNKLIGLCYATDELLDDAGALEGILRNAFVSEFGFMIDDAIINGLGAGQPLGILNSGSLVTQTKETGQAGSTIVAENVINMWSRIFASSRPNAVWLINQNLEPQLHTMSIAVGTGGIPIYMPAGGLSGLGYSTLFGRPVMAIEQCQSIGTLGDIYLGDFKNGYIIAEKGGMKSDMSIHVQFIYDESVFRYVLRLDGQPILSQEVTPYKGGSSYTQSHFITLQARA
jgi:HK97 family phage major capsid protein